MYRCLMIAIYTNMMLMTSNINILYIMISEILFGTGKARRQFLSYSSYTTVLYDDDTILVTLLST